MAICVVKSCRSQTSELFCAPDQKDKLKKWKMTIGTCDSDSFLICERHFTKEHVIIEKSLTANAFPTLLLKPSDYRKEFSCGSCLKQFENSEERAITGSNVVECLKKFSIDIKLNSSICRACDDTFSNLQNILIIQEMKKKNPAGVKFETIVIDEDEEKVEQAPVVEKNVVKSNPKVIINNPSPSADRPVVPLKLSVIKSVQATGKIIYYPAATNRAKPYQLEPQKISISNISGQPIKIAMPTTHDYTIPLKDSSDENPKPKQSVIITKRRQSAAPMTIISNALLTPITTNNNDKKIEVVKNGFKNDQHGDGIEKDIPMSVLAKRRASVPNPPANATLVVDNSRVLPTKEFQCRFCPERFQTSLILRLHEEKHTQNRTYSSSTRTGLNNFKCFDCNNSFPSYYFLRRHRETCTLSLRLKCSYQYCRFRASSAAEVSEHFTKTHANSLKCDLCDELLSTPAQLISHQVIKHGKKNEELNKKRRGRRPKVQIQTIVKRPRADLDFDSNESIPCEQCKEKVLLEDLTHHVTICKKF